MIVFALRHADRTHADDLSPAGRTRAKLLARMLGESGVSIAYRSNAVRAARTLEPLKQALGAALTIEEVGFPEPNGLEFHITTIVNNIKALPPDAVAVVVSHSNTVGPILQGLGAGPITAINDTEFDKLFVLSMRSGSSAELVMVRYGSPPSP
jgi:phosphohistidine phosphatase SixA